MTGVREYSEGYPVELVRNQATNRLVLRAHNEGHNNVTEVDLFDVLEWLQKGPQESRSAEGVSMRLGVMGKLTFEELAAKNLQRVGRWHNGDLHAWSVSDWGCAMAGEAGEACNAIKKLRRVEDNIANLSEPGPLLATRDAAIAAIGAELADTAIYLDLLAQRLGLDLADEIVKKFNLTSERYGFPERLP